MLNGGLDNRETVVGSGGGDGGFHFSLFFLLELLDYFKNGFSVSPSSHISFSHSPVEFITLFRFLSSSGKQWYQGRENVDWSRGSKFDKGKSLPKRR